MEWMDQDPATAFKLQAVNDFVATRSGGGGTCSVLPDSWYSGTFIEHYDCGYKCTFDQVRACARAAWLPGCLAGRLAERCPMLPAAEGPR
jgi:hypothetical protein